MTDTPSGAAPHPPMGFIPPPVKPERPWYKKKRFIIPGGLVAVSILGSAFGSDEPSDKVATKKRAAVETKAPKEPKPSPSPETPKTPEQKIDSAVSKKLGKLNRKIAEGQMNESAKDRVWNVNYTPGENITLFVAADDNLTEGLTKTGARILVKDVIEVIKKDTSLTYKELVIVVTFPLVDNAGNTTEDKVIQGDFTYETVQQINVDAVDPKRLLLNAKNPFVHPAFAIKPSEGL